MFELKPLYKILYLYQVTFAFGLSSVTHSNKSFEIALMFTLVGETAKTERTVLVLGGRSTNDVWK